MSYILCKRSWWAEHGSTRMQKNNNKCTILPINVHLHQNKCSFICCSELYIVLPMCTVRYRRCQTALTVLSVSKCKQTEREPGAFSVMCQEGSASLCVFRHVWSSGTVFPWVVCPHLTNKMTGNRRSLYKCVYKATLQDLRKKKQLFSERNRNVSFNILKEPCHQYGRN